jgi:hypothetical protein
MKIKWSIDWAKEDQLQKNVCGGQWRYAKIISTLDLSPTPSSKILTN